MGKRVTGIVLILLASLNLSGCASRGEPDASKDRPNANESSDRSQGSDARLFLEGRNSIMVAVDEQAFAAVFQEHVALEIGHCES